jgi:DNA polymerase-3 subunit delta'
MSTSQFQWPIVGHENIVEFLQKGIANDRLAHAYLFYGPEHIGKTTVTENFIASLLCDALTGLSMTLSGHENTIIPCKNCIKCEQLARNIHPDIFALKREEDKKNISIEQTRELQGMLNKTSFLNSYKIAIIKEAETLSEEAADSLLKALEEPSNHTIIILLSTDINLLPATIVSRCQAIKFLPVSQDKIFHFLTGEGATRQLAYNLSHLVNGRIGLAANFFRDPNLFKEYENKVKIFLDLVEGDLITKFQIVNDLIGAKKGLIETIEPLREILDIWSSVLRDLILIRNGSSELSINIFIKENLEKIANKFDNESLLKIISKIKETKKFFSSNVNPKLALENLVLEF